MGASGAGKSALALELMARGAVLVSDDKTWVRAEDGQLIARAPDTIRGMIEARGLGILNADPLDRAALTLAIDLDKVETTRLPQRRKFCLSGQSLPLLHRVDHAHFPAAILQMLKAGRRE